MDEMLEIPASVIDKVSGALNMDSRGAAGGGSRQRARLLS